MALWLGGYVRFGLFGMLRGRMMRRAKKSRIFRRGPDLILEGDGDIWHIADVPKSGRRSFTYDSATDLITAKNTSLIRCSYDIDQIGESKKEIGALVRRWPGQDAGRRKSWIY